MRVLFQDRHLVVVDYVCRAGPQDTPFTPGRFRKLAKADRKILQAQLARDVVA